MKLLLLFLVALLSEENPIQKSDSNTFASSTARFSITKPKGWHFTSVEDVIKNRERVQFKDPAFEKKVRERRPVPLVVISKYKEPKVDVNPTVQVGLRPLGPLQGLSPTKIMELVLPVVQSGAFKDFRLVERIREAKVSGLDAAYVRATYKISVKEGESFEVISRMWFVPRGSQFFMIGMSGPRTGPDVSDEEFDRILKSIRIEK